jgi:hypothetical protein
VLRVAHDEARPGPRADDELEPGDARRRGDERDGAVRVAPGGDGASPLAEVEYGCRPLAPDGDLAERVVRVSGRELRRFRRIRGDGEELPLRRESLEVALRLGSDVGVRLRPALEKHLEQLSLKDVAQHPPEVGIGEDDRADVLLRKPHHVAVIADHVAPMVHDGYAVLAIHHQAHAIGDVLPDRDLRLPPGQ